MDESLRGYMTKYDCSSADINPIGKHLVINENDNENKNESKNKDQLNMRIVAVLCGIVYVLLMFFLIVYYCNYIGVFYSINYTFKYVMSGYSVVDLLFRSNGCQVLLL